MCPQGVALVVLSFISLVIVIVPLILHAKNRNYPASALICWLCLLNIFNIVNAFIWPDDNLDGRWNDKGLCDVEVKIMTGSYVGIPGTLVPIFRSLAFVLDTRRATLVPTKQQRRWGRFIAILFCAVVPVISMLTNIIYQRRRFFLTGISGCVNSYDQSYMSLLLAWIWPPIISMIAGWYCALVLIRLHKYRNEFGDVLACANSTMTKSRFLRLFFLAFTMLLAIIPLQSFIIYYNCTIVGNFHPFSWAATHGPELQLVTKMPSHGKVFFDRWLFVVCSFLILIFFGSGRDATKLYYAFLCLFGLDHYFTSLQATSTTTSSSDATHRTANIGESLSSRAKLLFSRRTSSHTSYDPEHGLKSHLHLCRPGKPWFRFPWVRSGQSPPSSQVGMTSLPSHLSGPSNTVCTTAWASISQSRGSCDLTSSQPSPDAQEFIRVKQVISQQSEATREL